MLGTLTYLEAHFSYAHIFALLVHAGRRDVDVKSRELLGATALANLQNQMRRSSDMGMTHVGQACRSRPTCCVQACAIMHARMDLRGGIAKEEQFSGRTSIIPH